MNSPDISDYYVSPDTTIHRVIEVIDKNKDGIALVVDECGQLVGTVTDGDIRRFMLANRSFDEPCANIMWTKPITALTGSSMDMLRSVMNKHRIRNIPLIDESKRPTCMVRLHDLMIHEEPRQAAVIMAGGEGRRLRPLTEDIPKPMVRLGDHPILENIIVNMAKFGITNLYITVNYHAEVIEDYFQDGANYGVNITYLREEKKLGTAGALSLLPEISSEPILVMNGDVVTNINFANFLDFHRRHRCVMCVAATQYHINIPYGVLNLAGHFVLGVEEKPSQCVLCNAGIYMINSELLRFIPSGKAYDMTDLLGDVVREGLPITAFPIHEYWIDIGQEENLRKAREDFRNGLKSDKKGAI